MNDLQVTRLSNDSPAGSCKIWQSETLTSRDPIRFFIKQKRKCIFLLLIDLSIILTTNLVFAQNPSTQIEIDFSKIQGVSAGKETFTLELKDSKVDISHMVTRIRNLVSQSEHQNLSSLTLLNIHLEAAFRDKIRNLCSSDERCLADLSDQIRALIDILPLQRQKRDFLYPDNYHPIGSLPSGTIQKANSTSCCYDHNVAKTLLYGSSSQYNQIINKLKDSGESCLKQAGHAVIENLQSHTVFERTDSLSFCRYITNREDKARCQQLQNDYKIIQERITSLTNLIRENETPLVSRSSVCLENIANNYSLTSQISLFKRDLENHQACGDYSIGEERIKSSTGYGGGGYTIKRESNSDYTANLFIEFVPSAFYDNEDQVSRDQVQGHYAQRIQSCIDRANPHLKGPNGQKLSIIIKTPSANACVPKNTITIWDTWSLDEAQALNYPSNINNCRTTTHEILHVLGLADEYGSSDTYYPSSLEYDDEPLRCSMSQENSVMHNREERWSNVFDLKTEDSLLDPTHFNVILYRGCSKRDDVRLYNECELLNQTTEYHSCSEKKFYCDRQNILGRDKSRELQRIDRMLQEARQQNRGYPSPRYERDTRDTRDKKDTYINHHIQELENKRRVVESWPDN